jgi:hypothetical protein
MQGGNLKKMYNFQFILLTFLFWAPSVQRKFQLQDLWSCALIILLHTHTHHTFSELN